MNEQRFDEVFRDKLAGYSEQPTAGATKKLNAKFASRKRKAWAQFGRLAAAILLVAMSVYVINRWNNVGEYPAEKLVTENQTPETNVEKIDKSSSEFETLSSTKPEADTEKIPSSETPKHLPIKRPESIPENTTQAIAEEPSQAGEQEPSFEAVQQDSLLQQVNNEPVRRKVTITYKKSPDPPNPMLALQPQTGNKNKGLKKIWRSISPGDISLAGFRATKDQILAINKKNKNKESKSN